MTDLNGNPILYAYIHAAPGAGKEVKYKDWKSRLRTYRFYSILYDLQLHGVSRMDAEKTATWVCRHAQLGETRQLEPGVIVEIVEDEE